MLSWILSVSSEHENFIHRDILHFLVLEIFDFKM